jgi:hypothetical protein
MGAFAAGKNVTFIRKETVMSTQATYLEQIQQKLKQTPIKYLPTLLTIIHNFRGRFLDSVATGFSISWQEMLRGECHPINTLWDDMAL